MSLPLLIFSKSLTHILGPLFAAPSTLTPNFTVCDALRYSPFRCSFADSLGTGLLREVLQHACCPTGLEAEGEGPGEALCSPEDVDEAARDQGEAVR